MENSEQLELLKPFVGNFLQLPDDEKIAYITENWSFYKDYAYGIDVLLLRAQKGLGLSPITNINIWRRLILDARIHGLEYALSEHERRLKYFREVVQKFVSAKSLDRKKEIIKNETELLTSTGLYITAKMVNEAIQDNVGSGNIRTAYAIMYQHMVLLIKCTEFGIELPFTEIKSGNHDYWFVNSE